MKSHQRRAVRRTFVGGSSAFTDLGPWDPAFEGVASTAVEDVPGTAVEGVASTASSASSFGLVSPGLALDVRPVFAAFAAFG